MTAVYVVEVEGIGVRGVCEGGGGRACVLLLMMMMRCLPVVAIIISEQPIGGRVRSKARTPSINVVEAESEPCSTIAPVMSEERCVS